LSARAASLDVIGFTGFGDRIEPDSLIGFDRIQ